MSLPPSIGPYRIVSTIGEGAAAEVFLAQQRDPVPRRVAVKLLKPGHDSKEVLSRFQREQQALAVMDHAHIAKVLDAGVHEDGRPYFVLEYVAGLPITTYCDRRGLDLDGRLGLFVQLCEAVQHAHQKGVIHRDLKPSNVLVTEDQGRPHAKVIDFGIAKALAGRASLATMVTRLGAPIGTPEYMSPEQAAADALDVDTRTDVYALGVILYELLCGTLPFTSARLRASGYEGMLAILRHEEPAPPSRQLSTEHEGATRIAQARGSTPASLRRALRGDLDCVVLKAMAKDRNRRYATPRDLAADVTRALRDEAVEARPQSVGYRVAKYIRRHRTVALGAAGALFALIAALVTSRIFLARARASTAVELSALADAKEAGASADASFATALQAVDELLTRVGEFQLAHVPQMEVVRRNLLLGALDRYQDFLGRHTDDPGLRQRLAQAHSSVGRIHRRVSDTDKSIAAFTAAAVGYDALAAAQPTDRTARAGAAWARCGIALGLQDLGRTDEARALYDRCIDELQALVDEDVSDRGSRLRLTRALRDRATLTETRDIAAAKRDLAHALVELRTLAAAAPTDDEVAQQMVRCGSLLARMETNTGRHTEAEALLVDAIASAERLVAASPGDADLKTALADARGNLARCQMRQDKLADSDRNHLAAIAIWQQLVDSFPNARDYRHRLATARTNRSAILGDRVDEALDELRQASTLLEQLVTDHPQVTAYRRHLAHCCNNLASCEFMRDALDEAERWARRAIVVATEVSRDEPSGEAAMYLASGWRVLGMIETERGNRDAARQSLTSSIDTLLPVLARHPDVIDCRQILFGATKNLCEIELQRGDTEAALQALRRAFPTFDAAAARPSANARDHGWLFDMRCLEFSSYRDRGDYATACEKATALPALARSPQHELFVAVAFARCLALVDADQAISDIERAAAKSSHTERALTFLRQARAGGAEYKGLARDVDFAPLWENPDFQQLCREWK